MNTTLTQDELNEIYARAHQMRAEACRDIFRALGSWIARVTHIGHASPAKA